MWKFAILLSIAVMLFPACSNGLASNDSDETVCVYSGKSLNSDDNFAVYIVKNSIVNGTKDKANRQFSADVKILSGMLSLRRNYSFRESDGSVYFSENSQPEAVVVAGSFPDKIWKYGLNYLGID